MAGMWRFQLFYLLCLIYLIAGDQENHIAQLVHKALKSTARDCMAAVNATEEDLQHIRHQDPPYPDKTSCILKCLLEKIGVVRNNKYSKMGFLTVVTPLVMTNQKKFDHMRTVSDNCDSEVNNHEVVPCQLGNEIVTCIFKYAPELHFKS